MPELALNSTTPATYTIREAATLLKISERKVQDLVKEGALAHQKFGRSVRILGAPLRKQLGLEA